MSTGPTLSRPACNLCATWTPTPENPCAYCGRDGEAQATPDRAAEHWPGEPAPVEMLRDLQFAIYGYHSASALSSQEEWFRLLALVREFVSTHIAIHGDVP